MVIQDSCKELSYRGWFFCFLSPYSEEAAYTAALLKINENFPKKGNLKHFLIFFFIISLLISVRKYFQGLPPPFLCAIGFYWRDSYLCFPVRILGYNWIIVCFVPGSGLNLKICTWLPQLLSSFWTAFFNSSFYKLTMLCLHSTFHDDKWLFASPKQADTWIWMNVNQPFSPFSISAKD